MEESVKKLGEVVSALMEERWMNIGNLAVATGLSVPTLSAIMDGTVDPDALDLHALWSIADALGTDLHGLFASCGL